MAKRIFAKQELLDLDLPYAAVFDEIVDTDRWSVIHRCVFEYDGKHYEASYSQGATEMQDENPWDDDTQVTAYEVEMKPVTTQQWVRVAA